MATNINTILSWFKTGLKPTQKQFWATWASFWHKDEQIPQNSISGLENALNTKAEKALLDAHLNDKKAHADLFDKKANTIHTHSINDIEALENTLNEKALLAHTHEIVDIKDLESALNEKAEKVQLDNHLSGKKAHAELFLGKEDKSQKGLVDGYAPLNEFAKIASQYLTIINDVITGGAASILSAEQGVILQNQIDSIKTLLASDNINLDTIQEIVDAIETLQISSSTILVNDLSTGGTLKALTAEMGKVLQNTKLTATIATDGETQITAATAEDNKVITRSKLFNWWTWIRSNPITLEKNLTLNNSIFSVRSPNVGTYPYSSIFNEAFYNFTDATNYIRFGFQRIYWKINDFIVLLESTAPTQNNTLRLPNKSGTLAVTNDFLTTPAGTITQAPLIVPIGNLLTTPVNGAIETDRKGIYYTINGIRKNLTSEYVIDTSNMQDAFVYLWGNNTVGVREDIFPMYLASNLKVFNDYTVDQYGKYTINISGILMTMGVNISDFKIELQMLISNSKNPDTWYTVSAFEDTRENIIASLPQQVTLSAELLIQVLRDKYVFITGRASKSASESYFKTKTQNLSTSDADPKKNEMLVSFRLKTTTTWNTAINYQNFTANFGLIKMIKI